MKNLVLAVGVSVLALAGCDNNANAQAQQVSADVGSPQGNNTLIIEEGYTVVDPVQPVQPSGAVDVNNQMQPLPGDPGVDVAGRKSACRIAECGRCRFNSGNHLIHHHSADAVNLIFRFHRFLRLKSPSFEGLLCCIN